MTETASRSSWKSHIFLKITNVICFIFFFGTSLYSSLSPHGHYGGKETYLTPSTWTFYVWTLIDILLLGYVIYQFFDSSLDIVHGVGWRFPIVAVLNAIFVHVFVTRHFIVAFIFSLFVASTVSTIYYSLKAHHTAHTAADAVFVHLPFSLWHSWSIITVFISAFAAFTHGTYDGHGNHPGVVVRALVAVSEVVFTALAVGYSFQSQKGDIAGAAVMAWTLLGIYDHQHSAVIKYIALAGFIVSLFAILKSLYFTFVRKDSGGGISLGNDERAPLIG